MSDEGLVFTSSDGKNAGVSILKLVGPLTLGNLFAFQAEFRQMKPEYLIVDLSGVPYMDSAGLGVLINGYVSAQADHRRFSLVCVNQRIASLMEMTKVHTLIPIFPNVEEAEQAKA